MTKPNLMADYINNTMKPYFLSSQQPVSPDDLNPANV